MSFIQISNRLLSISPFGKATIILNYHHGRSTTHYRQFHFSHRTEKTINVFKKVGVNDEKTDRMLLTPLVHSNTSSIIKNKSKSIWQRIIHELKYYYNGLKLLFIETKIAFSLLRRIFNGYTLTRRERKQFNQTLVDLLRLVPFSIFIIVPFMEFTLPIFLKFFPNMLPSTFKKTDKQLNATKQAETTQFLQDTFKDLIFRSEKNNNHDNIQPSIEEIIKFSEVYSNQLTLDNLSRLQLIGLCKLLNLSYHGPNSYLRLKLSLKFYRLKNDDQSIVKEGIENLDIKELKAACYERGMNLMNNNIDHLQLQLKQWIDLHINKCVPIIILLLANRCHLSKNKTIVEITDNTRDFIDIDQLRLGLEQIIHQKKCPTDIKYITNTRLTMSHVDKRRQMY